MKKTVLLIMCVLGSSALFAQNEPLSGDMLVAHENYEGATVNCPEAQGEVASMFQTQQVQPTKQMMQAFWQDTVQTPAVNLNIQQARSKSRLATVLFVIGGVAAVGGTAATYLVAPKFYREDWSKTPTDHSYKLIEKRNPLI